MDGPVALKEQAVWKCHCSHCGLLGGTGPQLVTTYLAGGSYPEPAHEGLRNKRMDLQYIPTLPPLLSCSQLSQGALLHSLGSVLLT